MISRRTIFFDLLEQKNRKTKRFNLLEGRRRGSSIWSKRRRKERNRFNLLDADGGGCSPRLSGCPAIENSDKFASTSMAEYDKVEK